MLLACGNKARERPVSHDAALAPRDAAPAIDASVSMQPAPPPSPSVAGPPFFACKARIRPMGAFEVVLDPKTMAGELLSFNTSKAPTRHLRVIGRVDGSTTTVIFDGYLPDDHTFKGKLVKRDEKLVRGKSVLVHLRMQDNELRLYPDGELALTQGFESDTAAGYFVCMSDGTFITHLTDP